jgi:hypothetical protein
MEPTISKAGQISAPESDSGMGAKVQSQVHSKKNEAATSGETIQRWNRQFQKLDKFQHPNRTVHGGKSPEPSPFEHLPESKDASMKRFSNGNLADLTTEPLRDFIATKLLIKSCKDIDPDDERKELLEHHMEKTPSITTVWRWMRRLGHKHSARKKSFHVDGHERACKAEINLS